MRFDRFVHFRDPEDTEEPRCRPGPFSMANADTTSQVLRSAGFEDVRLRRCDLPIRIGRDDGPDGVIAGSSTWIVTARAPA